MSVENNKALIRAFYEAEDGMKAMAMLDEICHPDYVRHAVQGDLDLERYKQSGLANLAAFPDMRYTLHDVIGEGDRVATRWTLRGTHRGEFNGIPPTHKVITFSGAYIHRFSDGKIIEEWAFYNPLTVMQQLGAVPTPGEG